MLLAQLWTDFLRFTQPVLSGGTLVVILQMGLGVISPLMTMFRAIERESKQEAFFLCMVPFVLITAFVMVQTLFFGSFLGGGFYHMADLRRFIDQSAFFEELLILSGIFIMSAGIYLWLDCKSGRFSLRRVLFNVGIEGFVVLAVLLVSVDHFDRGGQLFHLMNDTTIRWFIYGIYLLLFKSCLYLSSLLWHLCFSQKKEKADWPLDYVKWMRYYLSDGYRVLGWALVLYGVFATVVIPVGLYREEGINLMFLSFVLGCALMLLYGVYCLLLATFPLLNASWRRISDWGDLEEIAEQLHEELVEDVPYHKSSLAVITEHFLVVSMTKKLFYLPLLQEVTLVDSWFIKRWQLKFADGVHYKVKLAEPELSQVIGHLQAQLDGALE